MTVSAVLLQPEELDPRGLLSPGAPIECGGVPGWVVYQDGPGGYMAIAMDIRGHESPNPEPVEIWWYDEETWDGPPLRLRLGWEGKPMPEGCMRLAGWEIGRGWESAVKLTIEAGKNIGMGNSLLGALHFFDSDGQEVAP